MRLIHIGHTRKARGISGSFKLQVFDDYLNDLIKAKALFINLDGSKVPFMIERIEDTNSLVIKVEEIDSPEAAQALLGKEIFLHEEEVSEKSEEASAKNPLLGFHISDQNGQSVGKIEELLDYPDQILARVEINGKTILIPIHDDLICDLDEKNKTIQLTIADGLLTI